MKRVGVLTFFRPINYGAVLQAYASTRILKKKMGYSAELIDYRSARTEYYRKWFRPNEYFGLISKPSKMIKRVGSDILYSRIYSRRNHAFDRFLYDHMPISSKVYHNEEELQTSVQEYDFYIVGSDLVWNPEMTAESSRVFFLSFVQNPHKRCISYAASIGLKMLSDETLVQYRKWLNYLDCISVREPSAAALLQPLTNKKVETVVDPTLLTTAEDWLHLLPPQKNLHDGYVLSIMLEYSPVLIETVKRIASERNLEIVSFDLNDYYRSYQNKRVFDAGPGEFLSLVRGASCIVTNSFHGCAFSLIFHREFYCIPHTTRGTRMIELLSVLELNDIVVKEAHEYKNNTINYSRVDKKIDMLRQHSLRYLKKALGETDEAL